MVVQTQEPRADWDAPPGPAPSPAGAVLVALWLAGPALLGGIVVWALLGPLPGVLIAALIGAATWIRVRAAGPRLLRRLRATALPDDAEPRARNLVEGLARRTGMETPSLWLIPDERPNALVTRAGGPAVALTRGLLDGCSRTELEAVVAHCLVRLRAGSGVRAATALDMSLTGARPLADLVVRPPSHGDDVRAAALTRYPPGVARAIEKAVPVGAGHGAMWFVPEGPSLPSVEERLRQLSDL